MKGLKACTPSEPLTNLEILHYVQNDRAYKRPYHFVKEFKEISEFGEF